MGSLLGSLEEALIVMEAMFYVVGGGRGIKTQDKDEYLSSQVLLKLSCDLLEVFFLPG
jgi:hypothetical protein